MTAYTGEILTPPTIVDGTQDGYLQPRLAALSASGINPIPHYSLSCLDNVNTRHYWVDTSISLTNAPAGFTYVSNTLVVEGTF